MCYTYDKSKAGDTESFKVGWYPLKKTGSSHLNFASPNSHFTENSRWVLLKDSYENFQHYSKEKLP